VRQGILAVLVIADVIHADVEIVEALPLAEAGLAAQRQP
jgi:hypothetical protein